MVREFALINERGEEYSLMDIYNHALLTNPGGLGYSYKADYEAVGNTFVENLRALEQGQIIGELNFMEYDNFTEFVNYIERSVELRIKYKIPYKNQSAIEYFKNVKIQSIGKTEKKLNGIISEPIIFDAITLWYEENQTIFTIGAGEREIRWDFKWDSRFVSYDNRRIIYNNQGHVEAPFLLEISGQITNPGIEIYVDGILVHQLIVNVTLSQYEKLIYNTTDDNPYLYKQESDGTLTRLFDYPYIQVTNENIFKLPQGASEIHLVADTDVTNAKLTVYPQYKVV